MRLIPVVLLAVVLAGCSNFRASRKVDMAPFAEHTISLVADISYGFNQRHAVHLRKYMDDPSVIAYEQEWGKVRTTLRGVAAYSLAIVTLSKSDLSEQERLDQLAGFLDGLLGPVADGPVSGVHPTRTDLDRVLADIRVQKNFLDGLGAAQPIVDWVAFRAGADLDSLKILGNDLEERILARVEEDFAGVVQFNDVIRASSVKALNSATLLHEHRNTGDPAPLRELRESDPGLGPYLPSGDSLTPEEIERAEERIVWRLNEYRKVQVMLADDVAAYNEMVRELDELGLAANSLLMKTRATVWIWSKAHARLAAGITDPARIDIMGIAKKAMDAALPY